MVWAYNHCSILLRCICQKIECAQVDSNICLLLWNSNGCTKNSALGSKNAPQSVVSLAFGLARRTSLGGTERPVLYFSSISKGR